MGCSTPDPRPQTLYTLCLMPEPPAIRLAPVTLKELLAELHAPRLLRVPILALRPSRIGIGAIALLLIALIDQIPAIFDAPAPLAALIARVGTELSAMREALGSLDLPRAAASARALLIDAPADTFTLAPFASLVLFPLMLVVWAIGAGAISRSAACEFAQRVHISWPQSLAFSLSHALSLAMALILPVAFVLALVLLIAAGAWLLLSLPFLNVLGAILFPLLLLLGFIAVLTLLGLAVGHWMLAPAVACEATDAIDAIQRVYHYVLHRLIHLLTHIAILAILAAILLTIASIVLGAMDDLVAGAIARLAPDSAEALLTQDPETLTGPDATAARIIATWRAVPALLLSALAVSFAHCAGSVLYLLIRDINDHQAVEEIWMPTMIEGTQAPLNPE